MPIKVVFSYAHEDETLLNQLKTHLKPLERKDLIELWYDRDINAGAVWEQEISQHMDNAQIIILLVSPDFLNSDYCYGTELKRALERHERGEAYVIPVILRPIYWQGVLGHLHVLPKDALPITEWQNRDRALYTVTEGLREVVARLISPLSTSKKPGDSHSPLSLLPKPVPLPNPLLKMSIYHHLENKGVEQQVTPLSISDDEHIVIKTTPYFAFGPIETTWIVVDGDGISEYVPQNIRSHYNSQPDQLPEELQVRRKQVKEQHERNHHEGSPFQWNGERYSLDKFLLSRNPTDEAIILDLWFRPSDYYTYLATNLSLKDQDLREKYLQGVDWRSPVRYFSNSFGISLVVITSDHYTILTQRGQNQGSRPSHYSISVSEGLSRPLDQSTHGQAPDVYRCAIRGLAEELGLKEYDDFIPSNIILLSFGVDTQYAQWGLRGIVKVKKRAQDIMDYWNAGVKDKMENTNLFPLKFELETLVPFIFSHESWAPAGLVCLYHAIVHEFGRKKVHEAIERFKLVE
jgi:hypothetical protein